MLRLRVCEADGQAQHAAALPQLDDFSRDAGELGLDRLSTGGGGGEDKCDEKDCERSSWVPHIGSEKQHCGR